jgi:hypothetical protein
MTYLRPHHPAATSSKYMIQKKFHKECVNHGIPLCKVHNRTFVYKLADNNKQVNCEKCKEKMKKGLKWKSK